MHIESIRFKRSKATQKSYADLLKSDFRKKCKSETAGAVASLMSAYLTHDVTFEGRDQMSKEVLKYLRRTTRITYRLEESGTRHHVPGPLSR